jgi:hypothetical protein
MKTKIISKMLLSLGLVFVLGSAITQVRGETPPTFPVVSIHSTGNVARGQIGSFVLKMNPTVMFGGIHVNFKVGGTAIAGVDYVALVSPTYIGNSGYATILVKTLPNRRGFDRQAYSVIVKLEPGPGYTIAETGSATEPSSAQMMIEPSNLPCCE